MLQYPQQQPSDAPTPVMRLRDDPQPATPSSSQPAQHQQPPTTRQSRKRKTPPSAPPPPQPQPPPPGIHLGQMLPPPHALMPPGMGHPPMYQYAPPEYAQPPPPPPQGDPSLNGQDMDPLDGSPKSGGRQLSQSKRAEQNRKAQRAFRERRDQCVHFPTLGLFTLTSSQTGQGPRVSFSAARRSTRICRRGKSPLGGMQSPRRSTSHRKRRPPCRPQRPSSAQ